MGQPAADLGDVQLGLLGGQLDVLVRDVSDEGRFAAGEVPGEQDDVQAVGGVVVVRGGVPGREAVREQPEFRVRGEGAVGGVEAEAEAYGGDGEGEGGDGALAQGVEPNSSSSLARTVGSGSWSGSWPSGGSWAAGSAGAPRTA